MPHSGLRSGRVRKFEDAPGKKTSAAKTTVPTITQKENTPVKEESDLEQETAYVKTPQNRTRKRSESTTSSSDDPEKDKPPPKKMPRREEPQGENEEDGTTSSLEPETPGQQEPQIKEEEPVRTSKRLRQVSSSSASHDSNSTNSESQGKQGIIKRSQPTPKKPKPNTPKRPLATKTPKTNTPRAPRRKSPPAPTAGLGTKEYFNADSGVCFRRSARLGTQKPPGATKLGTPSPPQTLMPGTPSPPKTLMVKFNLPPEELRRFSETESKTEDGAEEQDPNMASSSNDKTLMVRFKLPPEKLRRFAEIESKIEDGAQEQGPNTATPTPNDEDMEPPAGGRGPFTRRASTPPSPLIEPTPSASRAQSPARAEKMQVEEEAERHLKELIREKKQSRKKSPTLHEFLTKLENQRKRDGSENDADIKDDLGQVADSPRGRRRYRDGSDSEARGNLAEVVKAHKEQIDNALEVAKEVASRGKKKRARKTDKSPYEPAHDEGELGDVEDEIDLKGKKRMDGKDKDELFNEKEDARVLTDLLLKIQEEEDWREVCSAVDKRQKDVSEGPMGFDTPGYRAQLDEDESMLDIGSQGEVAESAASDSDDFFSKKAEERKVKAQAWRKPSPPRLSYIWKIKTSFGSNGDEQDDVEMEYKSMDNHASGSGIMARPRKNENKPPGNAMTFGKGHTKGHSGVDSDGDMAMGNGNNTNGGGSPADFFSTHKNPEQDEHDGLRLMLDDDWNGNGGESNGSKGKHVDGNARTRNMASVENQVLNTYDDEKPGDSSNDDSKWIYLSSDQDDMDFEAILARTDPQYGGSKWPENYDLHATRSRLTHEQLVRRAKNLVFNSTSNLGSKRKTAIRSIPRKEKPKLPVLNYPVIPTAPEKGITNIGGRHVSRCYDAYRSKSYIYCTMYRRLNDPKLTPAVAVEFIKSDILYTQWKSEADPEMSIILDYHVKKQQQGQKPEMVVNMVLHREIFDEYKRLMDRGKNVTGEGFLEGEVVVEDLEIWKEEEEGKEDVVVVGEVRGPGTLRNIRI